MSRQRAQRGQTVIVKVSHFALLGSLIALIAVFAVRLHRDGHALGDDFALYLRQAQSVFDGNMSEVVADNRFSVVNSGGLFSPTAYPWGFPLILSPFVQVWELDYAWLKLVEVAVFCAFCVLFHGIVKRRTNRIVAWVMVAALALSPIFLRHTDNLLSEYPHMLAVAVVVWWMDRTLAESTWLTASRGQLATLGVLGAIAFNMRREGLVLIGVFAVAQAFDMFARWREGGLRRRPSVARSEWGTLATPHVAFVGGVVIFQLLAPTALIPDNDDRFSYIPTRSKEAVDVIAEQLGFGLHTAWGVVFLAVAGAGALIGLVRAPRLHAPLVALAIGSGLMVGTHLRMVSRYYFQVTPWVLFYASFAVIVITDVAVSTLRRRTGRRLWHRTGPAVSVGGATSLGTALACAAMAVMVPSKVGEVLDDIDGIQTANATGLPQVGPADDVSQAIFAAVERQTKPDEVVGFYRARMLTLYTDRRAIQTGSLETMAAAADYYAMRKYSTYSQPPIGFGEVSDYDMSVVWEDADWVLYRFGEE